MGRHKNGLFLELVSDRKFIDVNASVFEKKTNTMQSNSRASTVLFRSLAIVLKILMILGVFPWIFVKSSDDGSAYTFEPLKWRTNLTVMLANFVIWSLPFDIHFWYGFMKVFVSNRIITDESSLIIFLMVIENNVMICYGVPIMHHIFVTFARTKWCQFYKTYRANLTKFGISWNGKKSIGLPIGCTLAILAVYFTLAILYSFGPAAFAMRIYDDESIVLMYCFYMISLVRSVVYLVCAMVMSLEVSTALIAWIGAIKERLLHGI